MTQTLPPKSSSRRPVAGYILASIGVGVVGLVTAIVLTVSGIMNSFDDVSESYINIFEHGTEIGTQPTPVDLDDAKYTVVSFSDEPQQPSVAELHQQCNVIDPHGDPAPTNASSQDIADTDRVRFGHDLEAVEHVIFTHFEAREGTYRVWCQDPGLLSDGTSNIMGDRALNGIFIGLGSVVVAAGLFIMGVVNSSRNKKAQAQQLPRTRVDRESDV